MLNFLPIMLKIMPDYASKFCKKVYITILIEQEMTILISQETRCDNIYIVIVLCSADCCQKPLDTHTDSN